MDNKLSIPEYLLNEKIERAARAYSELPSRIISNLFLVVPVPKGREGDLDLETKYGKLKVFFCHKLQEFQKASDLEVKPTALLLDHHKFPYPKVN